MSATEKHALPREGVTHWIEETSFGTYARPTVADKGIVQYHVFNGQKVKNRLDSLFANPLTRSPSRRVDGKIECEIDIQKEIYSSGTLGVPANGHRFWKNFFGQMQVTWSITVDDYTQIVASTTDLYYTIDGTQTTVVEGGAWSAGASNDATATNIATWLDGVDGLSASAATNVVTVTTTKKNSGAYPETLELGSSNAPGGTFTISGVSVTYTQNDTQGDWPCHTVTNWMSTFMRAFTGVTVDEFTINFNGGDVPMVEGKAYAKDVVMTGQDIVKNPSGADFEIENGDAFNLEVNSVVAFRAGDGTLTDNSGEGFIVTTEAGTAPTTFTVEAAHGASANDSIEPYSPRPTATDFDDNPRGGAKGSFTKDGTTIYVLEGSVTAKNTHTWLNDHALTESAVGAIPGHFFVEAELTIRAAVSEIQHISRYYADASTDYAFVITVGTVAGSIFEISIPVAELQIETEVPSSADDTPVTTKMMLYGKATADGSTKALTITEK